MKKVRHVGDHFVNKGRIVREQRHEALEADQPAQRVEEALVATILERIGSLFQSGAQFQPVGRQTFRQAHLQAFFPQPVVVLPRLDRRIEIVTGAIAPGHLHRLAFSVHHRLPLIGLGKNPRFKGREE